MSETNEAIQMVTVKNEPKITVYEEKEEESEDVGDFEWKYSCVETEIKEENSPLQFNVAVESPIQSLNTIDDDDDDAVQTEENKPADLILKEDSEENELCNGAEEPDRQIPILECDQRLEQINYNYLSRTIKSRVKNNRIFCCDICNKSFARKDSLNGHIRTHENIRPYACIVCGKAFPAKSRLTQHLRIHSTDRPFSCQVCGKAFALKGDYNRHLNVHTGYRPFSCDLCNKAFPEKSSLRRHMRTHTGDRPFACEVCNQAFSVRISLTKHIRTHTGDRPYCCHLCNKTFTRKDSLNRHLIKMHGENSS
ncbi:hypothetical protein C0J52_10708 [Blattella germanica]|nr:hypothetical protein C0J52_10708 [Blattella germanica]